MTYHLAMELTRKGHKNYVISSRFSGMRSREILDGIEVRRIRPKCTIKGMPIMLSTPIEIIKLRPDVIHVHGVSVDGDLAALAAYLLRIPLILTYYADLGVRPKQKLVKKYFVIEKYTTFQVAKRIVVISRLYMNKMISRGVQKSKLELVPPGVDTKYFTPPANRESIKRKLGLTNTKTVLFVGMLRSTHAYKRLDFLIRAVSFLKEKIPNIKLVVIGGGLLKPIYEKLCEDIGVKPHVIFKGQVSDILLRKYYAAADVFVLPSPYSLEAFGIVALEAMSFSCPVVVTSACGSADVIREAEAGIVVKPFHVKALALAILKILSNKDIAKTYGVNGRRIAELYSWERIAERTEKVYWESLKQC